MKEPKPQDFFTMLRTDTIEGMFSDPIYGGNRNMVGWALINYPGVQRAYTPADLKAATVTRKRQSMAMMMPENPGLNPSSNVVLPESGSHGTW
jgi:hypothetical protein